MNRENYQQRQPAISERELERKYSKLDIKPADPNRTNCYTCHCGHVMKTIDINYGVTPMFMACEHCGGQSVSSFYKDIHPDLAPTHEWFVPTLQEIKKYRRNLGMLDHIFNGGLEIRKIKV